MLIKIRWGKGNTLKLSSAGYKTQNKKKLIINIISNF